MDPIIENEWHANKREPVDDVQHVGNVAQAWQWRERGINSHNCQPNKTILENTAEDILVKKTLNSRSCDLPGYPRSTFLMVFSPDGTKVASTHGNHNVYVSELASGKHVRILRGHPRTPWCIAFHPSHPQLIGSGCLSGQVRVWDLSGGSEVWTVRNETVIASVAFHPRDQLLVIATFNELYFWDWSQPAPFTKVCTKNINEKVRYVAFDSLGYKLITGISVWGTARSTLQQNTPPTPQPSAPQTRRDTPENPPDTPSEPAQENSDSAQEMMVNSYQNLVQRYDSLVRNYQRLFMARHQLTNTSATNTTDRGTDPMDTDASLSSRNPAQRSITITARVRNDNSDSTAQQEANDSGDGEGSSSRLLNLEVLSINSDPTRLDSDQNQDSSQRDGSPSTSRASANQQNDDSAAGPSQAGERERPTRWLPNPFSVLSSMPHRYNTINFSTPASLENNAGSSRTSVFTSHRLDSLSARFFLQRRRHALRHSLQTSSTNTTPPPPPPPPPPRPTTNAATQIDPDAAQTINESLDLIRDILRDSGTRLLNLITNMSLSTLANVERDAALAQPGAPDAPDTPDETERLIRLRHPRPRVTLSPSLRRDFISSDSEDSDNDDAVQVNLARPPPAPGAAPPAAPAAPAAADASTPAPAPPTNRMVVNLNVNGVNVTLSESRFRVRSLSTDDRPPRDAERRDRDGPSTSRGERPRADPSRPSTSRDTNWMDDPLSDPPPEPSISSAEAFRKVKKGVLALQRHTLLLSDLWIRGAPSTPYDLRCLWENLRRRALSLERQTGRTPGAPSYYTRTLMERCRFLTEMSRRSARIVVGPRSPMRNRRAERGTRRTRDDVRRAERRNSRSTPSRDVPAAAAAAAAASANDDDDHTQTSSRTRLWVRSELPHTSTDSASSSVPTESEAGSPRGGRGAGAARARRRAGAAGEGRRPRPDSDMTCTRHEIRMRAMQVLSIMFNMMMHCLEERGLSQLIIQMLKLLKKSLALTCLMLVTNRHIRRDRQSAAAAAEPGTAAAGEPRPEDTSEPTSHDETSTDGMDNDSGSAAIVFSDSDEEGRKRRRLKRDKDKTEKGTSTARGEGEASTSRAEPAWSDRLAVQISAANRNTSATARCRRETYIECKRQKALHRTNPSGNPIAKKKVQPPTFTYRIPAVRMAPRRRDRPAGGGDAGRQPPRNPLRNPLARNEALTEFEHRVNLFRIAHMQAVRMRNAARNRFRRLQTIRLYSPSSVREMFALQSNNNDNQPGPSSPDAPSRPPRPYQAAHRPHILTAARSEQGHREGLRAFDYHLNRSVVVPLVNDLPGGAGEASGASGAGGAGDGAAAGQSGQPQRLQRVHDYLQPIILAQNALVVEDGGGGGGGVGIGGLLDAGLVSEALPASTHRVQAWDFTTGNTPDIADSTKNIVVPRCRIHNDASIDISKDGRVLVALLPVPRMRNANHWLGVYSLEWGRLGQCLFTAVLEQSAVSVALSPTARHLAVGLGSRRFTTLPHARNNVFGLIYRLSPLQSTNRTGLSPVKELEQNWEQGFTSLNCLRWAPQPGQGLVYANNTGQLILMS